MTHGRIADMRWLIAGLAASAVALSGVNTSDAEASRKSVVRPYNAKLNRIASCESGRRWNIATGNGFFGGLQFTLGTWRSVGGRGMPHRNSALEQKYRAVKVFKRRGSWADWPVCGFR